MAGRPISKATMIPSRLKSEYRTQRIQCFNLSCMPTAIEASAPDLLQIVTNDRIGCLWSTPRAISLASNRSNATDKSYVTKNTFERPRVATTMLGGIEGVVAHASKLGGEIP